jgi:hypothetical protein
MTQYYLLRITVRVRSVIKVKKALQLADKDLRQRHHAHARLNGARMAA